MIKYGPAELAKYPVVAERARGVLDRVSQVVGALKGKDQTPADDAVEVGRVHIQEECVSLKNGKIVGISNPPEDLITTDVEACLSNGKLPIRIEGDAQVAGFKGLVADLTSDASGKTQQASVIGDELLKGGGFSGPHTYSYRRDDKHNREIFTAEAGGFEQTAIINPDGTIAQFREGTPGFIDKLLEKLGK